MNGTVKWRNIKYFYIGMNNGGMTVWVGNVAGMMEIRNAVLYLGRSKGTDPLEDIVIYLYINIIKMFWINVACYRD